MIEASGLARSFGSGRGRVEAVAGLDLAVAAGEVVGLLGPNGAGKSTTMRMLATLLAPSAGRARVAGRDLRTDPGGVRRRIGYVAQGGGTGPDVPVAEELDLQARLYGVADRGARTAELLHRLDLADLAGRPCGTLSGGQRRRLDVALGLVHAPALVLLDEPSTGLDPHSRAGLWEHVAGLRDREGTTVVVSTHYLEEADALCDRVLIIDRGRVVAEGSPADLKRRVSGDVIVVEPGAGAEFGAGGGTGAPGSPGVLERARAALAVRPEVHEVAVAGGRLRLRVQDGERAVPQVLRSLEAAGLPVASLSLARPSLDDVFLAVTGRPLGEAA
ncbi:ABC transporter ATP-binding protein [Actinomadura parmotrematis]|uniref:ATP-binding cassette domain-containing protein n=1 Tax=Actinomadura parmotrematis TaxID=2864039 RepID=A0ABS7FQT7_9ACTN|nr:ATP-binding cassette domain-containing protein [Actinomadura parmotrematis]MBW8482751.1 ATP-binding cassette domain-containing protein [Actinomadura parmotrematis]